MPPKGPGCNYYYYPHFIDEESEVQVDVDVLIWFRFNMLEYLRHYVPVQVSVYGEFKN